MSILLFFLHSGFMAFGLVLMVGGFAVVRFMKSKRWWLKAHKGLETAGAACVGFGLAAAFLMVIQSHRPHFGSPHTYLGAATVFFSFLTVLLGHAIFRLKSRAPKLRIGHHWSGRATLLLAGLSAFSGMVVAGIL